MIDKFERYGCGIPLQASETDDGECFKCALERLLLDWPADEVELRIELAAEKLEAEQLGPPRPFDNSAPRTS